LGPVAFGLVVTAAGYSLAWTLTTVLTLCAVGLFIAAQRLMAVHGPNSSRVQPANVTNE
jgi:urease accessory protein UreF